MSSYQIYRDLMRFTILKDGEVEWHGSFHLTPSGYGFAATSSDQSTYNLKSRGILLWRKLVLYKNGEQIDHFTPYRSHQVDVTLKRGSDIFIEGRDAFSFLCTRQLTSHGMRLASWDFPMTQHETTVYSLILLYLQGQGQSFGF